MQDETTMLDKNPNDVPAGTVVNEIKVGDTVVPAPTVTTTTTTVESKIDNESKLFACSVRGWVVLLLVLTACFNVSVNSWRGNDKTLDPTFLSLIISVVSIYFGQNNKTKTAN